MHTRTAEVYPQNCKLASNAKGEITGLLHLKETQGRWHPSIAC